MKISPPLVIASGPAGRGEYLPFLDPRYIGAYTLKTVTYSPKAGNPPPRMRASEFYVINRIGLENPGIHGFVEEIKSGVYDELFSKFKVIVSLGGDELSEYEKVAQIMKEFSGRFVALEFNFSCPNVKSGGLSVISDKERWKAALRNIRRTLKGEFLLAKIGIEGIFVEEAAMVLKEEGWDGVVLLNSVRGYHKDPDGTVIAGGLSGPIMKPISLRAVYEVRKKVSGIYIIGCGGVYTYEDALEYFEAGADAVCIGSALFKDPNIANEIGRKLSKGGIV